MSNTEFMRATYLLRQCVMLFDILSCSNHSKYLNTNGKERFCFKQDFITIEALSHAHTQIHRIIIN